MDTNDRRNLRQIKVTNAEFDTLLREAARRGLIRVDERQGETVQRLIADYIIPMLVKSKDIPIPQTGD